MRTLHTFGCPVFALRNELAGGNSLPKWAPCARLGLNLGPSMTHARNVSLVLNLATGLVSPQFHCNFDDFFETTTLGQTDITIASIWQRLAGFVDVTGITTPPANPSTIATTHIDQTDFVTASERNNGEESHVEFGTNEPQFDTEAGDTVLYRPNESLRHSGTQVLPPSTTATSSNVPRQRASIRAPTPVEPPQNSGTPDSAPNNSPSNVSSRGRQRRSTQAMRDSVAQRDFYGKRNMHYMAATAESYEYTNEYTPDFMHDKHITLQDDMSHPITFHAQMMGDIMYLHQALQQPDAPEFVHAVIKEINGHVENKNWKIILRSEVPEGATVVPSVWALRRKRDLTTNEITKYKARLNLHGGKQEFGVNYFGTYAPVITWFAVRLMLMFGIINSWAMHQVDFVMAYPQAPIEMDMYMDLPLGIHTTLGDSKDYVLMLLNNLYGQKQAG